MTEQYYPNSPESPNPAGLNSQKQDLPNAILILIFGIVSIVTCCCYGVLGIVLSVTALVLAGKSRQLYTQNPDAYTESSYKNINAGRICAIIGLILSALYLFATIIIIAVYGMAIFTNPDLILQQYR